MKNNFFCKFFIIFFLFTICYYPVKAEQFNFNITEIEILNNGNLYKGLKRGTIKTDNGIIINISGLKKGDYVIYFDGREPAGFSKKWGYVIVYIDFEKFT